MTGLEWWQYLVVALTTTAVSLILTPLALRLAMRLGIFDHPGSIKAQQSPVPYLGGAAIVVAFSAVVMAAALYRPPNNGVRDILVVLVLAVALSLVGLADDVRGLSPWLRLVVEIGAATGVLATGTRALVFLGHYWLDAVLTVLWIVGVTNAFNILDNMDGLSAGVAAIGSLGLFVVALQNGQFLVATMALALVGCALGFLRHNFHPAKIYMGDAGSLFLGFMLAVLCLRLRTYAGTRVTFLVPLLIVGVALFDTALVTIGRVMHRLNPLSGGRDHTSHRLVMVGIPVPIAVSLVYAVQAGLAWLAVVTARVDRVSSIILFGFVSAVALFLGALLGMVPVYDTSRRRLLMIQEVARHETEPILHPSVEALGEARGSFAPGEVAGSEPRSDAPPPPFGGLGRLREAGATRRAIRGAIEAAFEESELRAHGIAEALTEQRDVER